MELRQIYQSENRFDLLYVEPVKIHNFTILGQDIEPIDERANYLGTILEVWKKSGRSMEKTYPILKEYLLK